MSMNSTAYCKPLHTMAKDFVEQTLELPSTHGSYRDQIIVLDRAMKYVGVESASEQRMRLFQRIGPEYHAAVEQLMSTQAKEQASQRIWDSPAPVPLQDVADVGAAVEVVVADHERNLPPTDSNSTKRKRGEGGDDLKQRKWSKKATLEQKVEIMKQLQAERDERMAGKPEGASDDVTESARTWCGRTMTAALGCLHNHFGGDEAAFCDHWRKDFVVKFKFDCCRGEWNENGLCSLKS
jgi:hypothetical protein